MSEWICDDRKYCDEYFKKIREMSDEEFEEFIKNSENDKKTDVA